LNYLFVFECCCASLREDRFSLKIKQRKTHKATKRTFGIQRGELTWKSNEGKALENTWGEKAQSRKEPKKL